MRQDKESGYQISRQVVKESMDSNSPGVTFARDSQNYVNQHASVATNENSKDIDALTAGVGTTQSIFMQQTSRDQEDGGVNTGAPKNHQNNSLYDTTNDDFCHTGTNESSIQETDVEFLNNAMANS